VAAPCTLPMLPILLGASVGQTGKARPALIALGFVISFSAAALLLSAITRISISIPMFCARRRDPAARLWTFDDLARAVRMAFDPDRRPHQPWLHRRRAFRQGNIGGFVLGTTLGLVWTPCAGPVLGSILTVVATSKDAAWASTLLVVYAIGAAIRCWRLPMADRP